MHCFSEIVSVFYSRASLYDSTRYILVGFADSVNYFCTSVRQSNLIFWQACFCHTESDDKLGWEGPMLVGGTGDLYKSNVNY